MVAAVVLCNSISASRCMHASSCNFTLLPVKEATIKKIERIVKRQFAVEIQNKEAEIDLIDKVCVE